MSDDTSLTARLRGAVARLAPSQDGDPSPQARDEDPIAISEEEHTQEPDKQDIERWTNEYYANPLIRQSVRNFAADVLEPGATATVDTEDGDEPTVPNDYRFAEFRGLDLSDALNLWLQQCAIVGGRFDRDVSDLLEDVVIDLRGRRGTALVEHAYDDPRDREYILGLRTFKVETATAYTRDGKNILLKPDDDPSEHDTVAVQEINADQYRDTAPRTPADKTAAIVQFDDIFGRFDEKDDIPFALDDVTLISNDPDTGNIFGRPATASIVDRSEELREMFADTAQGIKAVGYGHWILQVDTDDEEEAKKLLSGFDPQNPERTNVINYGAEPKQIDGQVPDNVDHIQQQIEYILSALPTPLYRVGFAGDINRDVTSVQQEDYRDEIQRERDRLESAFSEVLEQKAREFMAGDAKAEDVDLPDVRLVIEPEADENPLHDEEFDASEFANVMQGLKAAAPGGAVEQVMPPHEVRETMLGLDPEPPDAPVDGPDAMASLPDEADEDVRETFEEFYDAELATLYDEGDEVATPDGPGVIVEIRTEDFTGPDGDEVAASEDSPTYIVGVEDGAATYTASDLTAEEIDVEGDVDPTGALEAAAAAMDIADATNGDVPGTAALVDDGRRFDFPESWDESPTPNRIILLKAWAGLGGRFTSCRREMSGEVSMPSRFCASMKDRVLEWEGWRQGG